MISFSCPDCGKELKVKTDLVGKRRKCPYCLSKVTVPGTPSDGQQSPIEGRTTENAPTPAPAANSAEAKTLAPVKKADDNWNTLPPGTRRPAVRSGPDANTLMGGVTGAKPGRHVDETLSPEGAGPSHPDAELTRILEPAQEPGELGRLGKYRVVKVLGSGGMGVVFLAEDSVLKRSVALKVLLPGMHTSQSARDRFLREAQSSASLQHDNVVTVYEVNEANCVPYLAMQLLQGEALDERLAREKSMPLQEVLRIGHEAADGLAAAHERGMIHRDIKPANLFLEAPKGRVKILDFGLARAAGEESKLTQFGTVVGTPGYLAPEQASGKTVDARADLFSLGCVLYRLTTGELPFKGEDMLSMLTALVTTKPATPKQLKGWVPLALSDLIMSLLSQDRDSRPASAHEVSDKLQAIAAKTPSAASPWFVPSEEEAIEPLLLVPAPVAKTTRIIVDRADTDVEESPAAPRTREDKAEHARRPRRKKVFPWWVVWTWGSIIPVLLIIGFGMYYLLRSKDAPPKQTEREVEKTNGRDSLTSPETRKGDTLNKALPPLNFNGNHWLTFSPDNLHFVSAAPQGDKIVVWDRARRAPDYVIDRLVGGVTHPPRFSSDGKKMIVGVGHNAVVYDMANKQLVPLFTHSTQDVVLTRVRVGMEVRVEQLVGVGFGENDAPLAVFQGRSGLKSVLGLFDVEKKAQLANGFWFFQDGGPSKAAGANLNAPIRGAIPTPDGRGVIVIDTQAMRIWAFDPAPGKGWSFKKLPSIDMSPNCVALSPDGSKFLTSHTNSVVHIWNAKSAEPIKSIGFGNLGVIDFLGFSNDSRVGLCCGREGTIQLWDVDSGAVRAVLPGKVPLFSVALAPDLQTALASSPAGNNVIWYNLPR